MIKPGIQSLHSHTLLSDGLLTHSQVLDTAAKAGIKVLAFTDHDALPDEKLLEELQTKESETAWLIGIEISAGLPKELGGGANGPHMVGLFIDPFNKELLEHCRKSQEMRLVKVKKLVKGLKNLGFDITEQECIDQAKGTSVGQPHVVTALKSKEKNLQIMNQYIEKMKKAAESDPEAKKRYLKMLDLGEDQYPYSLFLGSSAYFSVDAPHTYWLDFDQCASLIRKAGGLAFIAHYTFHKKDLPWENFEKLLKEGRVDGAETVYGLWNRKSEFRKEIDEDRAKIRQILKKHHQLPMGGTDAHKEKDFYDFAADKEYSGETVGMVEKIIEKANVNPSLVYNTE
jgi:predicted metal-dependent phosphoesterase TrpH